MPTPIQGVCSIVMIIAVTFSIAFAARFLKLYSAYKKSLEREAERPNVKDEKIYYIRERLPEKRKKRVRRKPKIAFSEIVVHPKEFNRLAKDDPDGKG